MSNAKLRLAYIQLLNRIPDTDMGPVQWMDRIIDKAGKRLGDAGLPKFIESRRPRKPIKTEGQALWACRKIADLEHLSLSESSIKEPIMEYDFGLWEAAFLINTK